MFSVRAIGVAVRFFVFVLPFVGFSSLSVAKSGAEARIVGGQDAASGAWPWMVALVREGEAARYGQFCAGTLIDSHWVLTAAHCVTDGDGKSSLAGDIEAVVGVETLSAEHSEAAAARIAISKVVVHPAYTGSPADGSDIALLKLAKAAEGETIALIDADQLADLSAGELLTITGWGLTNPDNGQSRSDALQEAEVPLVSEASCSRSYSADVDETMVCAGYQAGGVDSCQGDSGGPLKIYIDGEWQQVGVTSFGLGCAQENAPGVYANVAAMRDFIANTVLGGAFSGDFNLYYSGYDREESRIQSFTNESATTMSVDSLALIGDAAAAFEIQGDDCSGNLLEPGQACAVAVAYKGQSQAGEHLAQLQIGINGKDQVVVPVAVIALPVAGLSMALDGGLQFYSGGERAWGSSAGLPLVGLESAVSGDIGNNESSVLLTYVDATTPLSFHWQVSSESGFDYLSWYQNDELQAQISGETEWVPVESEVERDGTEVLWVYAKDRSVSKGADRGWVDNVNAMGAQATPDDVWEPNNAAAQAITINIGESLSSQAGDAVLYNDDWYAIDVVESNQLLEIELRTAPQLSDLQVRLYQPNGMVMGQSSGNEAQRLLSVPLSSAGVYRIQVVSLDRSSRRRASGHRYDLTVRQSANATSGASGGGGGGSAASLAALLLLLLALYGVTVARKP